MELTEDEILQILKLVEESHFDELHLEMGGLKLIVSKGGRISAAREEPPPPATAKSTGAKTPVIEERKEETETKALKTEPEAPVALEEGLIPIKAPMLGTFYRRPEPGAPPYVEVGSFVKEDDTVCLLEVMKVFSAVKAGVQGYITQICAESGQLVEYGQTLFLVKPEGNSERK